MSDMLLDFLRARVGDGAIHKVSSRKGGEYHSPCPHCGGNDRFICFPEQPGGDVAQRHGLTGTWSCPRHCQTGGDVISFLTTFEGLSFGDACKQLGIDSAQEFRRYRPLRQPGRQSGESNGFTPRAYPAPADQWVAQATKLATKAHERLQETPAVLAWLARRGLPLEAVRVYGLGYIEGEDRDGICIFRTRESFGLPTKFREDGKPKKLRIPRGVTIPVWSKDRNCLRIRIRRRNTDIDLKNAKDSKYLLVPQPDTPYSAPLLLPPVGVPAELATWVVVESELDAMAVHHACGGRVGGVSVLTVAGKPDASAHNLLSRAARVLVALDFDEGKAEMPAAQAWHWWEATYPQARLWPVPVGKDPGEAFALGLNLGDWVQAGMPNVPSGTAGAESRTGSVAQPAKNVHTLPENGELGASHCGSYSCGEGEELHVPAYLALTDIPADVLTLAAMWQGKPIVFTTQRDAQRNCQGFSWDYDHKWAVANSEELQRFLKFQNASATVWDWLSGHRDCRITAENFLYIWGE